MAETIRVFIGSDIHNIKAERALIYSILKHTKENVQFTIMSRFGTDENWRGWQHTNKWATCFSCYRWAIPAVCKFEGKAIYLDSDMIVLKDIKNLFESDTSSGAATTPKRESSVMVFDCSRFKDMPEFQLNHLKQSDRNTKRYYDIVKDKKMISFISQNWNCLDGNGWDAENTCLIHYTELPWQPWHPAPQRFNYVKHPHKEIADIWLKYYEESFDPQYIKGMPLTPHNSPLTNNI